MDMHDLYREQITLAAGELAKAGKVDDPSPPDDGQTPWTAADFFRDQAAAHLRLAAEIRVGAVALPPAQPAPRFLGVESTRDLLAEVALRMDRTQNSTAGRDLAALCRDALERLDKSVLGPRPRQRADGGGDHVHGQRESDPDDDRLLRHRRRSQAMGASRGDGIERLDVAEFRRLGYLQEANRRFFHPLGLALEVTVGAGERLGGVWDYRSDPDGVNYGPDVDLGWRAARVQAEWDARKPARRAAVGYMVQPVPDMRGSTDLQDELVGILREVALTLGNAFGHAEAPYEPQALAALALVNEALGWVDDPPLAGE